MKSVEDSSDPFQNINYDALLDGFWREEIENCHHSAVTLQIKA